MNYNARNHDLKNLSIYNSVKNVRLERKVARYESTETKQYST